MSKSVSCVLLLTLLVFTLPSTGQNKPFPFAAIGDSGCDCKAQRVVAKQMFDWYKKKPFGMVLMLGDNIYAERTLFGGKKGGHPDLFEERFDEYYKPLLDSGVKFFAVLGNHDVEADNGRSMIADKERFHMIGEAGFYSYEPDDSKGLITFFALNSVSMVSGRTDKEQVEWLREALKACSTTWKIVYMHHPMYGASGGHHVDSGLFSELERVLIEGGVQVVLSGHNHYYARSKPQQGITYIISGGAGRSLVSVRSIGHMEKAAERFHFLYFEAAFNRLDYWAITADGALLDRGFLEPNPKQTPTQNTQ